MDALAMLNLDCNWLLAFREPGLEAMFWASPMVRSYLLGMDVLAAIVTVFNNSLVWLRLRHVVASQAFDGALSLHRRWGMVRMVSVLATNVALWRQPDAYYRNRTAIIILHRAARIASYYFQLGALPAGADARFSSLFQQAGTSPAVARSLLLKNLALRPSVFLWMNAFLFPLPFAHQAWILLLSVPAALGIVGAVVGDLTQPPLLSATCEAYRFMRRFTLHFHLDDELQHISKRFPQLPGAAGDGLCPPYAPQYVAWFFTILFGFAAPLFLAYVIEAFQRLRFLRTSAGYRAVSGNVARFCANLVVAFLVCVQIAHFVISLTLVLTL